MGESCQCSSYVIYAHMHYIAFVYRNTSVRLCVSRTHRYLFRETQTPPPTTTTTPARHIPNSSVRQQQQQLFCILRVQCTVYYFRNIVRYLHCMREAIKIPVRPTRGPCVFSANHSDLPGPFKKVDDLSALRRWRGGLQKRVRPQFNAVGLWSFN